MKRAKKVFYPLMERWKFCPSTTRWSKHHPRVIHLHLECCPQPLLWNSLLHEFWCIIHHREPRSEGNCLSSNPQMCLWPSEGFKEHDCGRTTVLLFFFVHFHINRGQTISFLTYQDIKHMQRSWQTHSTQAQSMGSKQRDAINVRRAKEQLVVMGVSNRFNVSTISRSWLWYDKLKVFYNSDYWHKHHQRNKDLN